MTLLPVLLLGACLVEGEVLSPRGEPLPGVEIVHAPTGEALALTAVDGSFRLEVPEGESGETVLEFRAEDRLPTVRRTACGSSFAVVLYPRVYEMESVEISASRLERAYESTPVRVERLDELEIREAAGASPSLSQAVQQLPGVGAVGRDGFTSAPTIRGLGRDRSLILIEGVRLSSDRGVGPSGSFLDPFLVRSLDVVRGASGVAYGSGAIGGVLSTGLGPTSATFDAAARVSATTNADGRLLAGRITGTPGGGWRSAIGGFYRTHDDYSFPGRDGFSGGDATNSGFENAGGTLVLERSLAGGGLRVAALATSADEVGRPTTRASRRDTIESEDHVLASVQYRKDEDGRRTEATLGFHRPETSNRTERFDGAGILDRTSVVENTSIDGSASLLLERPLSQGSWLAGLDFFSRTAVDAEEKIGFGDAPAGVSIPLVTNGSRIDVGAFLGWKRTIGYVGEVLVAGRLDWAQRDADDRVASTWIAPSFSAGVVYPWNSEWSVTGSLNRSFRAPRIQELYFAGDRPGGTRLANPDLEPESAWSLEGGVRWEAGAWSSSLVLWGLRATDLIVQLPVDDDAEALRNENESEGRILGVETELSWKPRDGRARGSLGYAFLHGQNEDGDPLPDIPSAELRLTGEMNVYEEAARSAALRVALRAGSAKTPVASGEDERWWSSLLGATDVGGDEEGHAGFARWDAGLRVRVTEAAALDVSVSNLFDSRYLDRPESAAFPQPGRTWLFELTLGE